MKTIKVCWTEREVIEYCYEEEFEVEDDFVVNSEHLIDRILDKINNYRSYDSINTNYEPIAKFLINEDGDLKIPDMVIDSYVEILPPSPEAKRNEYLDEIERLSFIVSDTLAEKERLEKLLNELQ
jgi:hypothetical protein